MQEKIKVEKLSDTKYKVSLNIPAEEVDKKFDEFFKSVKKQAQIPGFRKGKAPISRLKAHFGQKAKAPVSQMLIGEYYTKVIQDNEINPIGNPEVQDLAENAEFLGKFGFDNSFSADLIIETLPKIDPEGYVGLELDFPETNDKMLFDIKMREFREQFAERNQITDRGAQLLDSVVIDFKGFVDGKPFEGGEAKGYSIDKLGHGNFIPGFEDQIIGTKAGEETEVNVTFPKEYRATHLAGKEARFEVKVHNIVETKLAEVDDDLAMMVGYESVDELNEKVKQDADKEKLARNRQMMDRQIMTKLFEANEFTVPQSMVDEETNRLRSRVRVQGEMPEQLVEELRKNAEYNVKRAIITDAIYEKEDSIEVTPDELNELLEEHAKMNNKTKDELVSALYNSGQMDSFVGILRVSKVIDFIIDNVKKESEEDNGRDDTEEASSDGI